MPRPDKQLSSKRPAGLLGVYILIAFVVAIAVIVMATRKHEAGQATAIEQTN